MRSRFVAIFSYLVVLGAGVLFYLLLMFFMDNYISGESSAKNGSQSLTVAEAMTKNATSPTQEPSLSKAIEEMFRLQNTQTPSDLPTVTPLEPTQNAPKNAESTEAKPSKTAQDSQIITPKGGNYRVKVTVVNIRELPDINANIIRKAAKDESLTITDSKDNWGALEGGGFVSMSFVEKLEPAASIAQHNESQNDESLAEQNAKKYIVKGRVLNVREFPNTAARILRQIAQNEHLAIVDISENWGRLQGGGFVSMDFVQKHID